MKIVTAVVYDPRDSGQYRDPYLRIVVDEEVEEVSDPIYDSRKSHEYRLIPCGPFFAPQFRKNTSLTLWEDMDETTGGDYGELNKLDLVRNQLFEVIVHEPDGNCPPMALEVPRARRLLRKHGQLHYELIVDEHAALKGLLKWRLELTNPMCYGGASPREDLCTRDVQTTIIERGTHLPVCNYHLGNYEKRMRSSRTTPRPRMGV